ncbi:hypothetical protein [Microlunatus sp. Y2014]|uniref:hypothetical protein n=1 Tax=Microlunatus sp. Y2014 TaxID=3418488 RepID=UPI003DA71CCE
MSSERSSRAEDAALLAELAASHGRGEAAQAQVLIDAFVGRAREIGLPLQPLTARLLSGHQVRTDARGWYIKNDRSVAIGAEGEFYVLVVPGGWRERIRGVVLKPSPPPLVVARGARDGVSGDLAFFLDRTLRHGTTGD